MQKPNGEEPVYPDTQVASMNNIVELVAILSVFGMPTGLVGLFLHQRHRQKMKALEGQVGAKEVAALEAARADLEARVRTLETIATGNQHDLEEQLRRLVDAEKDKAQRLLPRPQT